MIFEVKILLGMKFWQITHVQMINLPIGWSRRQDFKCMHLAERWLPGKKTHALTSFCQAPDGVSLNFDVLHCQAGTINGMFCSSAAQISLCYMTRAAWALFSNGNIPEHFFFLELLCTRNIPPCFSGEFLAMGAGLMILCNVQLYLKSFLVCVRPLLKKFGLVNSFTIFSFYVFLFYSRIFWNILKYSRLRIFQNIQKKIILSRSV